jgi:transposase
VIVTVRPKYACPKGRTGVVQAKAPAHLLEGSWPTEPLLAQIAVSKHSEHMPLNRQAVVMARHGVPIDRSVLADWMGRTGALIAPVVDHMAKRLLADSTRLYVDETAAPVLDPGKGKTKTGYLWAVLRDDRGWGGTAPPGVVFHYRPGRKGEYAAEILAGFNGTIQVDAYGGYSHLATPKRTGGDPLRLAFCWAHGRRKLIKAKPKKRSTRSRTPSAGQARIVVRLFGRNCRAPWSMRSSPGWRHRPSACRASPTSARPWPIC